jgi:hypothetical protein
MALTAIVSEVASDHGMANHGCILAIKANVDLNFIYVK